MKLPYFAALVLSGCLASFQAHAVPTEYDWTDSSNPGYTGEIVLSDSSGNQLLSLGSPIISFSITANGTTFTSANSTLVGSFGSSIIWDAAMIDTMALQITLNDNPNNVPALSVQDSTINGAGGRVVDGSWTANSVPDAASTLSLFAIGLAALGWYYLSLQRQKKLAPARIKQQRRLRK